MDYLYSVVPRNYPNLHNQTELSDITDEEFDHQWKEQPFQWYHRIFQVICYLISLGPIRTIIGLGGFFLCQAIVTGLRYAQLKLKIDREKYKTPLLRISQIGFHFYFIAMGHIWIKKHGQIDPESRVIVTNHTALHDGMIISCCRDCAVVSKASFKVPPYEYLFDMIDPIYVRRDMAGGQTKAIIDHAQREDRLPILIFSEGTITNGDVMLKFHRSAFLTGKKVQPMLIRYSMPLVPKGWNSYAWTVVNTLKYLWDCLSIPLNIVNVYILPSHEISEYNNDVEEFTKQVHLQCANCLGVKAVTRSSDEIFKKRRGTAPAPQQNEKPAEGEKQKTE